MRKTIIKVHNNSWLEVFVRKSKQGFEVWVVGMLKGQRRILCHHLTHDDLEQGLGYSKVGDLVWKDAAFSEIPRDVHPIAAEAADNIERGVFVDFKRELRQSLAYHIMGSINILPLDKKEWNVAKEAILGQWTDGIATVNFQLDCKLAWSCPGERLNPFNSGARGTGYSPNWWSFAGWQLHLLNYEHMAGTKIAVLRVDQQELHVFSGHDAVAHIYCRVN
jgi:hypothetical protein